MLSQPHTHHKVYIVMRLVNTGSCSDTNALTQMHVCEADSVFMYLCVHVHEYGIECYTKASSPFYQKLVSQGKEG